MNPGALPAKTRHSSPERDLGHSATDSGWMAANSNLACGGHIKANHFKNFKNVNVPARGVYSTAGRRLARNTSPERRLGLGIRISTWLPGRLAEVPVTGTWPPITRE
jgi:hypothetical protein